jgi:hypothetical protein
MLIIMCDLYARDFSIISIISIVTSEPLFAGVKEVLELGQKESDWMEEYEGAMCANPSKDFEYEDAVLYFKGRLFIRDNLELKKGIVEVEYDSVIAGHMGADNTVELVRRNFFWP